MIISTEPIRAADEIPYVEIQSHLDAAEHKHAAMDDAHYAGVDDLIRKGVSVEEFLKMIKEKHSVRSCDNDWFRPGFMYMYIEWGWHG